MSAEQTSASTERRNGQQSASVHSSPLSTSSTHQLVQFDWRLVTTVGCSSSSAIPSQASKSSSGTSSCGMPLLQLTMETAAQSAIKNASSHLNGEDSAVEDYFTKFPSAPGLNLGMKPSDTTLMWELNAVELDEVIARLQSALAIADKACPPTM